MKDFNQDTVTKRFSQLPEPVQNVILSDELASNFETAMREAGLSEADTKLCNQQATLVLVGLTTTKDFRESVTQDFNLDTKKAEILFASVSKAVFAPVRDKLLEVFDAKKEGKDEVKVEDKAHNDPYREQV